MRKESFKLSKIVILLLLFICAFSLIGCKNKKGTTYTVDLAASPNEAGNVTGVGSYKNETSITINAQTNEGYSFLGWYEGDTILSLNESFAYTVTKDVTLTAKWNKNEPSPIVYTLSFNTNGGESLQDVDYKVGEEVKLPTPNYLGYEFLGWYDSDSWTTKISNSNLPKANITLYAKWGVMINFDTKGGDANNSIIVDKGTVINEFPIAIKTGSSFVGWYVDEQLTKEYDYSTSIQTSITLHAKYSQNSTNAIIKMQHFDNITENAMITIYSLIPLNNENISDYFSITNIENDELSLILLDSTKENEYYVSVKNGFIGGLTYTAKTKSSQISFKYVDKEETDNDTTQVSFKIYKEEYNDIVEVERKHISTTQISYYDQNVRTIQLDYSSKDNGKEVSAIYVEKEENVIYSIGDIISIGINSNEAADDAFYKVVDAKELDVILEDETISSVWYLEIISPELEDVYSSFDSYGTKTVDLENYLLVTKSELVNNINNSEGIQTLSAVIGSALYQSPTVNSTIDQLPEEEARKFKAKIDSFKLTLPDVTFSISNNTIVVGIQYEMEIEVSNVCTITLSVGFSDSLTLTFDWYTKEVEDGIINKYLVQVNSYIANDFTFSLGAEIEFSVTGKAQTKVDIAGEVMDIIKSSASDINDFSEKLNGDPLFKQEAYSLSYIEIVNVPFGEIPIPLTNILTFSIEFNGVISLGGKAGLFVNINQKYKEQINISNGKINENGSVSFYKDGFTATRTHLESNFDLTITLKGKIGVRVGVELKLKLSIAHLNSIGSVYVSATVGPYIELTGMAVFEYRYDALAKKGNYDVYGRIYIDFGYYVNFKFGLDTLIYSSDTSLWSGKVRSYTYGNKKAIIRFTDRNQKVPMIMERSCYYQTIHQYELIDILNLNNGEIEYGKYYYGLKLEYSILPDKDYSEFVEVDENGVILIKGNFKGSKLDFSIHIKVKDQTSLIGKTIEKDVPLTFYDPRAAGGKMIEKITYNFINRYSYSYGGSYNLLANVSTYVGAKIIPPVFTDEQLPIRDGYYIDREDMWVKYVNGDVDDTWDGSFDEAKISDYGKGIDFVLNWKLMTFDANYFLTSTNGNSQEENTLYYTTNNVYVYYSGSGGYSYFVNVYNEHEERYGYKFLGYSLSGYDSYRLTIGDRFLEGVPEGTYRVFSKGFTTINDLYNDYQENGLNFYGIYTPITYTIKWDVATFYVEPYNQTYKVIEYQEGTNIPLVVPTSFSIGTTIYNDFTITYYTDSLGNVYDSLAGINVTKDETYCAHATSGPNWLTYRINIEGDKWNSGYSIGSVLVKEGDPIPVYSNDEIQQKISTVVANYAESFTFSPRGEIPEKMPSSSYTIYYDVKCVYKASTVTFTSDLMAFYSGMNQVNTVSYTGYYKNSDPNAMLTYRTPELVKKVFYKEDNGLLYKYSFSYWTDVNKNVSYLANEEVPFKDNYNFTPVFSKTDIEFRVDFKLDGLYGSNVYYRCTKGDYNGKTLQDVLDQNAIVTPTRTDFSGQYLFEFAGWNLDNDFVFGSECDINGNVKTNYIVYGSFTSTPCTYSITLDADEGLYEDGSSQKTILGTFKDITDFSNYTPSCNADAENTYVFVGWSNVRENNYSLGGIDGVSFPTKNITYYAVYLASPQKRTITIHAGEVVGEQGGKGYFDLYENKTDTYILSSYDGKFIRLNANIIKIDNIIYKCNPLYVMSGSGDEATIFYFENDYVLIEVDGDSEYTFYYDDPEKIIYTAAFNSISRAVDDKNNEVVINGFMQGYVFNKYIKGEYGDTIIAPNVTYTGYDYFKFNGWKYAVYVSDGNGNYETQYQKYFAGDKIVLKQNMYLEAEYIFDNEVTYTMEFRSTVCYSNRQGLYDDMQISGTPTFSDGSYVKKVTGKVNESVIFTEAPSLNGFVFIGWNDPNGNDITDFGIFNGTRTYYANYKKDGTYTVNLYSNNGKFADNTTSKVVSSLYGTVCTSLEKPISNDQSLVFSYYADSEGNIVNTITNDQDLYAVYAMPIYTFADLKKMEINPNGSFVLMNSLLYFEDDINNLYNEDLLPLCSTNPNGFAGTLNGAGYSIGYYSTQSSVYMGLFAKLSGKVMNISFMSQINIITSNNDISITKNLGLVAGVITNTGVVENCYFGGTVYVYAKVVNNFSMGFIAGENNGLIKNCSLALGYMRIENSLECNGIANVGCIAGINKGTIDSVICKGNKYSLGVANSFELYYGSIAGTNYGNISNCVSFGGIELNFINGMNNYNIDTFTIGNICGKDIGIIKDCSYSSSFGYSISNVTMVNPNDNEEITVQLVYINAVVNCFPEMFAAWTIDNRNAFSLVINDNDEIPEHMTETYYLSKMNNAKKILSFKDSFTLYDVAMSNNDYSSCCDLSKIDYDDFETVAALGMTDFEYGWLNYIGDHAEGLIMIG